MQIAAEEHAILSEVYLEDDDFFLPNLNAENTVTPRLPATTSEVFSAHVMQDIDAFFEI